MAILRSTKPISTSIVLLALIGLFSETTAAGDMPGDWLLPAENRSTAKMPMHVVHPRDADSPDWAGSDIVRRRRAVHRSLEHLQRPVEGILGRYRRPFGPYSAEHPDAHEALGARDLCTSRFDQDGRLEHAE